MQNRFATYLALLVPFISVISYAQTSILWGNLKPGSYQVGFSVLNELDTSRQIAPHRKSRPIQISLWYPANHSAQAPLIYRDYLLLSAHELDFENVSSEDEDAMLEQYTELLLSKDIPVSAIEAWFHVRMMARPEIEPAKGLFPLIILAQGNMQSAHHQAILSEYIASHGYVVATSPSPMRISGPMTDMSQILSYAQEQEADMAFIFNILKHRQNVNPEKLGLIGHSFGARAALLLLTQLTGVDVLVSLDGGIANTFGQNWLAGFSSFKPEQISVPILHFYQDIEDFVIPDFSLLEALKFAPRYLIKIDQMRHLYFTSLGMATAMIPGFAPPARQPIIQQNYEAMCSFTLHFLDAFLKEDKEKQDMLFSGIGQKALPESFHLTKMQSGGK